MADTIQEKCLKAIKAELDKIAGVRVWRGRQRPPGQADLPVLVMVQRDDESETTSDTEQHELQVDIEGYLTSANDETLQTETNNLAGQAWARAKAAQADLNIVAVHSAGRDIDRDDEEGTPPLLAFTLSIIVLYQTVKGDPLTIG